MRRAANHLQPANGRMTMADTEKVLEMIKEHDVKYVDFRFTDPRGKWQHLAHHVRTINEDFLTDGVHVRRLVDRRLEGDQRVGHDAGAGLLDRGARPVRGADLADPLLRRARAADRPALRPRPALDRQEGRAVPDLDRHRRHRLFRARGRVLRVRRRALRKLDEHRELRRSTARKAPTSATRNTPTAIPATGRRSRAAISRCRRSTASPICAPRCCR